MDESTAASESAPPDQQTPRAKALPLRLPLVGDPPALVPARMVNEALYCERLMYLEWAQGEFADNEFTVEGRWAHRRADVASGALPEPAEKSDTEREPGDSAHASPRRKARRRRSDDDGDAADAEDSDSAMPFTVRSLWLSSERLGATAKIDVVEGDGGVLTPIEYKRGEAPDVVEGAYLPERAQVALQVMLLRDHGHRSDGGAIWFARSRRRVPIVVDAALEGTVIEAIARIRALVTNPVLPPPLVASPKCSGCSLAGICLPDEIVLLARSTSDSATGAADSAARSVEEEEPQAELDAPALRRLVPARDDRLPLYVQEQGARVSLDGEELVARGRFGDPVRGRLPNTSQVCLFGNVQISTQAMRALIERDIPVCFFTMGGWYLGRTIGHESKNVELRVAQYRAASEPLTALRVARRMVVTKIRNSRTMLRRNHRDPPAVALGQLEQLARKSSEAESIESLLGFEGSAARVYFSHFGAMLKGDPAMPGAFDFDGRNRRPPRDRVNALLSFAYALLTKDTALTLTTVGLDPLLGFYHQPRFGRPALALDMTEEMRPIIADSVVLAAVNTGIVSATDFVDSGTAVAIAPHARRRFILAYERRMDQLITHPEFGYRISYRRVLEVQARLLSRMLLGEIAEPPSFRTR